MKKLLAVVVLCGAAGVTSADPINYQISGVLALTGGVDAQGLNGATFTLLAHFNTNDVYISSFGFAAVVQSAQRSSVTIGGSSIGANNTTTLMNEDSAFYPTFAGLFSHPDGLHHTFNTGSGQLFQFYGNTSASAGSGDAFIGSSVELDDFIAATYAGTGGATALYDSNTGTSYTLNNAVIDAWIVPAPSSAALLGLGALVAGRRRR
ncbi:MAG: PEP-CTERM sorting domain-containing protein [Leptolyngbya sp. PLA3]|nr:MAG: PEP-CTERM sorting domain-containing protein [Cyanobacteria bacterium CYA]MCE7968427.1 PEP-CTERM sorting domain-containing protein [Leptolyngbya sp. PL-A3]